MHRGITLDNVLFKRSSFARSRDEQDLDCKLIDFGLACYNHVPLNEKVGAPEFMAPEMLKNKEGGRKCEYNEKVDIWALGVVTYRLVSKELPFAMDEDEDENDLQEMITEDEPDYSGVLGGNLVRDFISCCLKKNPKERSSAEELLKHGWFKLHEWCINPDYKFPKLEL